MKSDSVLLKKLFSFLMLAAIVMIGIGCVFRDEIVEGTSDVFSNNQFAVQRAMENAHLPIVPGFSLRPERNDAAFIRVTNLRPGEKSVIGTSILFLLSNEGDSNDFPNIKVILVNRQGKPVRELTFGPTDYKHADRFEQQEVDLLLQLRDNETGFTVKPFYAEYR